MLKVYTRPSGLLLRPQRGRVWTRRYAQRGALPGPFTRQTIHDVRSLLSPVPHFHPHTAAPAHTVTFRKPPREAAVLIPLMNIGGEAHILMQVRSAGMRVHAGEVSFPGGKSDPEDESLIVTALRETEEELAIPRAHIEILGALSSSEYSLGNRSRVWPLVGFVHEDPFVEASSTDASVSIDAPLRSFPVSKMVRSPMEVSSILPLPLSALQDQSRLSIHCFRMAYSKPYHKVHVADLVMEEQPASEVYSDQVKAQEGAELEIWGLSGWFLNKLAWRMDWMEEPRVSEPDD